VTAVRRRPPRDARDPLRVLGLVIVAVVLPAALATIAGAILIPHNDDFAFRRVALTLYETGRLEFTGWSIMTLVGQVALTAPLLWLLQGSAWAFAISTAALTIIGVAAASHLGRRVLSPSRTTFAVLTVLFVPGFLRYTTTYMTDVPAWAVELLCLALGATALGQADARRRWRWLVASLVVGWWAFSIREFALAAPVAVVIATAASDPNGRRAPYVVAGAMVMAACGALYILTRAIPGQFENQIHVELAVAIDRVIGSIATLAFALIPPLILCLATWLPRWRRGVHPFDGPARRRALAGGLVGLVLCTGLFAGDLATLAREGPGGEIGTLIGTVFGWVGTPDAQVLAGARPALYPDGLWDALNVAALVAAFVAFAMLGAAIGAAGVSAVRALDPRRLDSPLGSVLGLLVTFSVLYGVGIAIFGVAVLTFDRYVWPLVLPLSVLLLWRPAQVVAAAEPVSPGETRHLPGLAGWLAGASLAGMGVLSLALLVNSLAFDAARWRIGEDEVGRGVPAAWIDAGFEWVGYHATGVADVSKPFPDGATRYTRLWSSYRQCVVVSSSRLTWPGLELAATRPEAYRRLLFVGARTRLYVYRSTDPGCPP